MNQTEGHYELKNKNFCLTIWVRINGLGKCVYFKRYHDIRDLIRWRWYYEYLAARLKVAYPKSTVKLEWNENEKPDDSVVLAAKIRTIENRLRKCKADITKFTKAIDVANCQWNELERLTSQKYSNTVGKLSELVAKRTHLENELKSIEYASTPDVFMKDEIFYGIKMRHYGANGKINSTHFKFS